MQPNFSLISHENIHKKGDEAPPTGPYQKGSLPEVPKRG